MIQLNNQVNERRNLTWFYPRVCEFQDNLLKNSSFFDFLKKQPGEEEILLYIHIPFCESFCSYCACFKEASQKYNASEKEDFVECLINEMKLYAETNLFHKRKVQHIQFGGGTPSCLDAGLLEKIFKGIQQYFDISDTKYISFEGNVMTLKEKEKLKTLNQLGVNRLSFGIQTFNEEIRKDLNIKASVDEIYEATENIRNYDFSFAVDLIYNLPNQNMKVIEKDLELTTMKVAPDYIQTYRFNAFNNTALYRKIQNNYYADPPTQQKEMEMFGFIIKQLKEYGYTNQILINMFSNQENPQPTGLELTMGDGKAENNLVLGLGPGANSYIEEYSYRTVCSVKEYIASLKQNELPIEIGYKMSEADLQSRPLVYFPNFMKIDINNIRFANYKEEFEFLINNGYAVRNGDVISLTEKGILWAGDISYMFYSEEEQRRFYLSYYHSIKNKKNPFNQDKMNTN